MFGTDTTCETLYRLKLLYVLIYVRVGCIFKLGVDKWHNIVALECLHQSICKSLVKQANLFCQTLALEHCSYVSKTADVN